MLFRSFDGSGAPTLRLSGITDIKAQHLRVGFNTTGAAVTGALTVGEVSSPIDLGIGTEGSPFVLVIAEGFSGRLGDFLAISGDFAFQRTGSAAGGDITVAVTDADATFETPAFRMGVVLGNLGLLLPARGGVAVSVSGDPVFALKDGYSLDNNMAFQGVGFEYNSTGDAVDQQLVGGFNKTLRLPTGTESHPFVSAIVTGLRIHLGNFASLSGDFAFQYRTNGDLVVVAAHADSSFAVGDNVRGGVTGATLAILVKSNGTFALQTTGEIGRAHV